MPDHHNALPAGYRLGEYEIQTVLGSGGFGVTYKAYDHNLDKLVAIKEYLPPEFAVRDGRTTVKPKSSASKDDYIWGLDRFLDEARALARFDHPHINRVHRFFKENGTAYLVLEYIDGDMLSELLKSKGRFNEAGVRRMLDELLDGLAAVHQAGYIHRDIKPANIIFRRDGSAVLLDFGAARQAIGQRSQMITSILTPGYAPVEQYLNTADAMGAWSDLYSLGVVAYRCLVGGDESAIVDAPSRAHYAQRGESEKDMPSAVEVGKGKYSDDLLKAIDWAMKVDERERPQSVGELQAALDGEVEVAATEPVVKKTKKKVAKKVTKKAVQNDSVKSVSVKASTPAETVQEGLKKMSVEHKVLASILGALVLVALIVGPSQIGGLAQEKASFRQLVGKDASPRQVWDSGTTDLHIAAAQGWDELTEWLIGKGASVHSRIKSDGNAMGATLKERLHLSIGHRRGQTPLHIAAIAGDTATVKVLLDNYAYVSSKDKHGAMPLHYAAWGNSVGAAKLLIQRGANVRASDNGGQTPLGAAKERGHAAMINLLQ